MRANILSALALAGPALSQAVTPERQSTSWNSSFEFTPEQLSAASVPPPLESVLETVLDFERTQLANGGPGQDAFYSLNETAFDVPTRPGQVIKVQDVTDPRPYALPSKTGLSRIVYSTTNINGTLIPASAYVLWPYTPKTFGDDDDGKEAPVVLWTHGTSGWFANGAPSAHRSLFYGDIVPFALAHEGYAVVAPDYAGLGVETSWDESHVPHQYFARHAGAMDGLNALRAARSAFAGQITDDYAVMGHSQGGAVAWGITELLAGAATTATTTNSSHSGKESWDDLQEGYLGTVAAAPVSHAFAIPDNVLPWVGQAIAGIYPTFRPSDWFTPLGESRLSLFRAVQGGQFFSAAALAPPSPSQPIINPAWNQSWYAAAYSSLSDAGGLPFKGPVLVLQGTDDQYVRYEDTVKAIDRTCGPFPGDMELLRVPGAGHFPAMDAARSRWLRWIEDRFARRELRSKGCAVSTLESFRPVESYQQVADSFLQWSGQPQWGYQLPTAA